MNFYFPQKVKIGLGVSQLAGLAAREMGSRILFVVEGLYASTKELNLLVQSIDRAGIHYIMHEHWEGKDTSQWIDEGIRLAKAGRVDVIMAFGGGRIIQWGRYLATKLGSKPLPIVEIPTQSCTPLLMSDEGFYGTGHPADLKFFSFPPTDKRRVFLDPSMSVSVPAKLAVSQVLEGLFFTLEAYLREGLTLTEEHLLNGSLEAHFRILPAIFQAPSKVEFRQDAFQAGFSTSLCTALQQRAPGLSAVMILGGLTSLPPAAIGSIFLPLFLEDYSHRMPAKVKVLARLFGEDDFEGTPQAIAQVMAQKLRKQMSDFGLPLRLQDLGLVESEIALTGEIIRTMDLGKLRLLDNDIMPEFLKQIY